MDRAFDNCRQCCGYLIHDDEREDGFCSDGCQEVYERLREFAERWARQEGR